MLKTIEILEMSSYVWELVTDLWLHKTFCANLTALVWLNQRLILNSFSMHWITRRNYFLQVQPSWSFSEKGNLTLFTEFLWTSYLLARERKQPGTFAIATRRSACAILFAIRDDKGALHENFGHFLSVVQFSANICLEETDGCGVFSHWKEQWVFCWVKSR